MSTITGSTKIIRFILRRDRILLPLWIITFGLIPAVLLPGIKEVWPTQADRDSAATVIGSSPAFTALLGKIHDTSLGGLVAWRGSMIPLLLAIVTAMTVLRHTRNDEEAGRRELVGSTVVGRHASLAATLTVTVTGSLITGVIAALCLSGQADPTGSWMLAVQYASAGVLFAAIAAVAAQLTQGTGSARAIVFIVLGVAFVLRMASSLDSELSWASWVSPAGWLEKLEPFGDNNWYVLAIIGGSFVVLTVIAFVLQSHRDVEAGILPNRLGRAGAGASLSSPLGLAWRLQRSALIGWTIGFALLGVLLGSMTNGIKDLISGSAAINDMLAAIGGTDQLTDAFIASMISFMALGAAAFSIQAMLKLRSEESQLHAEQLLATNVSRTGWAASHLVFGFGACAVVLGLGAIGLAVTYGAVISDFTRASHDVLIGCAVQLPAIWVLTGLSMLLFGLVPRLVGLTWLALTLCLLFGQLGEILQLPQWALDLSPFTHVPQVPGHDVTAEPLVWLSVAAVTTTIVGLLAFRRRNLS